MHFYLHVYIVLGKQRGGGGEGGRISDVTLINLLLKEIPPKPIHVPTMWVLLVSNIVVKKQKIKSVNCNSRIHHNLINSLIPGH